MTSESRTEAAFISLFDTGIRSCARNHRNSLSRVIQNVAESHQALMARHRTSALGESTENCIRISYSLYLPYRTGPSTNISLREVIPTLPNSWRASLMRKTSRMPPYLWVRSGPWGIDCANLAPRRSKLGSSSFENECDKSGVGSARKKGRRTRPAARGGRRTGSNSDRTQDLGFAKEQRADSGCACAEVWRKPADDRTDRVRQAQNLTLRTLARTARALGASLRIDLIPHPKSVSRHYKIAGDSGARKSTGGVV